MPQIWIRVDAAGLQPVLVDEQQELPCVGDVDWHFVAVVEDPHEARRLTEQLRREHEHHATAARDSRALESARVPASPECATGSPCPARRPAAEV